MKKILIIAGSVVIILGAGGYAAYQYAMNMAADKLSEELTNDPELMKQIDEAVKKNEEEIAKLAEELPTDGEKGQAVETATSPSGSTGGTEEQKSENQASASSAGEQGSTASKEQPAKETSSTEKPATESKPSGGKEFSSRNEAVRFAMSRFSAGEMNEMRKMAADGLTAEEKAILKQKAFSNFSPEEMAAVQRALSN